MRLALLAVLLLPGPADGNPFLPGYPFQSAVVTYRKVKSPSGDLVMTAYARGSNLAMHSRRLQGATVAQEVVVLRDAMSVFTITRVDGKVVAASKYPHPGTHVAGDFAAMTDDQKAGFRAKIEGLWNEYSPVFLHNITGAGTGVKEAAEEVVAGRACVRVEWENAAGLRIWRWKGTDLILKRGKGKAVDFEAERIEVDVEIPDEIFLVPGDVQFKADSGDAVFDAKIARELFVRFGGILAK